MSTKLRARRRLSAGGRWYPSGSIVPEQAVRGRRALLIRTFYLEEVHQASRSVVEPIDLPTPEAPAIMPVIELIHVPDDPVGSVRRTKALMVERCGGDVARANDLLEANRDYRDMLRLAMKIGCAEEKVRRGGKVQSVSPNEIGL